MGADSAVAADEGWSHAGWVSHRGGRLGGDHGNLALLNHNSETESRRAWSMNEDVEEVSFTLTTS